MPLLHYKYNESLPIDTAKNCRLSVLLGRGETQFLVSAVDSGLPLLLSHVVLNENTISEENLSISLEQCIQDLKLLNRNYDSVSVGFQTSDFVLAPSIFAMGEERALLEFSNGIKSDRQILKQNINGESTLIYGVSTQLVQSIERMFSNVRFCHSGTATIQYTTKLSMEHLSLLAVIHDACVELSVKDGNTLLFYNCFETQSHEDVLYYTMYVSEQLGLQATIHPFYVAINTKTNDELLLLLGKYIKNLHLVTSSFGDDVASPFASLPLHYFFTLKRLYSCVS
jgi:hypothetical protein